MGASRHELGESRHGRQRASRSLCRAQSVSSKGEPFLSAFEPTVEGLTAALTPHGLALTKLLGPRCSHLTGDTASWLANH